MKNFISYVKIIGYLLEAFSVLIIAMILRMIGSIAMFIRLHSMVIWCTRSMDKLVEITEDIEQDAMIVCAYMK